MTTYYIKQYGAHELHRASCVWLPIRKGTVKLGIFESDFEALQKASTLYNEVKPCSACCNVDKKKGASSTAKK